MFYRTVVWCALEQRIRREAYSAAVIESTLIIVVLASRVPVTAPFCLRLFQVCLVAQGVDFLAVIESEEQVSF